jgi:hypothetical protein
VTSPTASAQPAPETTPEPKIAESAAAGPSEEPAADQPSSAAERSAAPEASAATEPAATESAASEPAASAAAQPAAGEVRYTHSGFRYVLGYSADAFGIWDRQSPAQPSERFPRTDDGWRQAWLRFIALEPNNTAVDQAGGGSAAMSSPSSSGPAGGVAMDPNDVAAVQYTHSGTRYLLGYGRTFFGIWDRQAPATPVEKFPRDDAGWTAAWGRFTQIENNFTEVRLGG